MKPRKLTLSVHERASKLSDLAELVRARRESLGIRQDELADLAECSTRFISMLEHAKPTIQVDKMLDVLTVLGIQVIARPSRTDGRIAVEAPQW